MNEHGAISIGLFQSVVYCFATVAFLVLSFQGIKIAERNYYPIITEFDMKYVKKEEEDDLLSITLKFNKRRDCRPLVDEFAWYKSSDDVPPFYDRIHFEIPETRGSISRPIGKNVSEDWLVDLGSFEQFAKKQKIVFKHICYGFWPVTTVIDVPKILFRKSY